jgi:hypothetical protein
MTEENKLSLSELPQPPDGSVFKLDRIDKLSVPHPYCLTPRHVAYAADQCSGMLTEAAIEGAEKEGAKCGICKGKYKFSEHEVVNSLIITVPQSHNLNAVPGLHTYLFENKQRFVDAGIDGFAFPTK